MKPQRQQGGVVKPNGTDWIAVGDASRFIVYEKRKGKAFLPIKTFENSKAHLKISDLEQDQPGRSFEGHTRSNGSHMTGAPRHAYASHQDPKEHALENFTREVSEFLDRAYHDRSFDRLTLIANSRLLGKMRSFLDSETRMAICAEQVKDFAWVSGKDLEDRIHSLLGFR